MENPGLKKVLILTYYWPPSGGAGVQRWLKFVKYLRENGWEPILYIPENPEYPELDPSLCSDVPEGITVLKTRVWEPYQWYKKLTGRKPDERIKAAFLSEKKKNPILESLAVWIRGNLFIPDARKFWIRPSVRFLCRYLTQNPVDVLVSTGPPHSLHLIGRRVSKTLRIPWLADFRDPWTNIDFYKDLKVSMLADARHRKQEKQVLRDATAVTVISRSMESDFRNIFPRRYDVITNGFDPDDIREEKETKAGSRFSIAHIGTLVQSRNPVTLWKTLSELVEMNSSFRHDLEIRLIGRTDHTVLESLDRFHLLPYLTEIPYLPHDKVITEQQQAAILLLIINQTPNARMILTGKFFEYLAARRPILCIGPADGDAAAILKETEAGWLVEPGDSVRMEEVVRTLYTLYQKGSLGVSPKHLDRYSRKELTKELAVVLDRMVQDQAG